MSNAIFEIDVDAEIRKLTRNRFKSAEGWVVALVKYVMRQTPTLVLVSSNKRRFKLSWDGNAIDADTMVQLQQIFSQGVPAARRHRAIVALEDRGDFDVLAPFAHSHPKVIFTTAGQKYIFHPGGKVQIRPVAHHQLSVEVRARHRIPAREISLLKDSCRYAAVEVRVNRKKVNGGRRIEDVFYREAITVNGVALDIGIPRAGNLVKTITVENNVSTAVKYKTAFAGLVYHAIVDNTANIKAPALRRIVRQGARDLYAHAGSHANELPRKDRQRLAELLFERYRYSRDPKILDGFRGFETVDGRFWDFETLKDVARRHKLFAIKSRQSKANLLLAGKTVLILNANEKHILEDELNIEIDTPPAKSRPLKTWLHSQTQKG